MILRPVWWGPARGYPPPTTFFLQRPADTLGSYLGGMCTQAAVQATTQPGMSSSQECHPARNVIQPGMSSSRERSVDYQMTPKPQPAQPGRYIARSPQGYSLITRAGYACRIEMNLFRRRGHFTVLFIKTIGMAQRLVDRTSVFVSARSFPVLTCRWTENSTRRSEMPGG